MTRHVTWQAILAGAGIALVFVVLIQLASGQETVQVPQVGGSYAEGLVGAWSAINPILAPAMVQSNPPDQDVISLVFEGLTRLDAAGRVSPALATAWEISEDASHYVFHLREGVTWHDGAPFSAQDVVFTVQAIQDPGYQGDASLRDLWRNAQVEQVDPYTVRFSLTEPFPSFLYYTTIGLLPSHLLSSVPAADLPRHEFSIQRPVGTGMFMVESVLPDQVVLVRNPNYWGQQPFLERLAFRSYADYDALLAGYDRGEIQGFHPPRSTDLKDLTRFPSLQLYSAEYASYCTVLMNLKKDELPFFQVTEVRQALLYALDRQSLVDQVLEGQALVADSPILPGLWAYDPNVRRYPYDPVRAMGLLDAAGWVDTDADRIRDKDGAPLTFKLLSSDDLTMVALAEELARQWLAVGVKAEISQVSAAILPEAIRSRDFDAALTEVALTADPDPYPLWHSTQAGEEGQNYTGFANDEADLAMEEARSTSDPQARAELYAAFEQIFAEQVPSILLYYPVYTYAVDAQVKDVQLAAMIYPSDRFRNVADWFVETSEVVVTSAEPLDNEGE